VSNKVRNFDTQAWTEMLNNLKKEHNTLYGVLRMASPEIAEDVMTLNFNFGFHKKQVENSKNITILRNNIKQHFGIESLEIKIIKKSPKNVQSSTATPQLKPNQDVVKSIRNIFGDAELID
jgi:hypothetical protein